MIQTQTKTLLSSEVTYDENVGYYYDYYHYLGTDNYIVTVTGANNAILNTANLFSKSDQYVRVFCPNDTFTESWKISVIYEDGASTDTLPKKRLFEQTVIDPEDISDYADWRLAVGGPSRQVSNVALSTLKTFCQSSLDSSIYLLKANDLSDLNDFATARNNLDVYDKETIDSLSDSLFSASGYVSTVSEFTAGEDPLSTTPTVVSALDFSGVQIQMSFTTSLVSSSREIGYVTLTPASGVTLEVSRQVFPVFYWVSNGYYVGQLQAVPTTVGDNVRIDFILDQPVSGTKVSFASFHINASKQI